MFEMKFSSFTVNRVIYKSSGLIPDNFHPKEEYLTRALLWRQKKDMNVFVLVVGDPRSSKSAYAIKKCERINYLNKTTFDIDKQLTFDNIEKFLIWSKDAKQSQFILDETGTSLSPDQFWSIQQRVMRRFVQTQGFRRNILFWVLPSVVFIQKNFRFLCNYGVKTLRQGRVMIYKLLTDQLIGKSYVKRVIPETFSMPSKELWNHYVDNKTEWNDQLLQEDLEYLKKGMTEKQKLFIEYRKALIERMKSEMEYRKEKIKRFKSKPKGKVEVKRKEPF